MFHPLQLWLQFSLLTWLAQIKVIDNTAPEILVSQIPNKSLQLLLSVRTYPEMRTTPARSVAHHHNNKVVQNIHPNCPKQIVCKFIRCPWNLLFIINDDSHNNCHAEEGSWTTRRHHCIWQSLMLYYIIKHLINYNNTRWYLEIKLWLGGIF